MAGETKNVKEGEMKALDLFCGAGGSAMGLKQAGFEEVFGVDIKSQPEYPFRMREFNTLEINPSIIGDYFDFIWASPPCQAYSWASFCWRKVNKLKYPDLMRPTRELLLKTGKPFVIENVCGAPLRKDLILCGEMFGLKVIRHRIFEIHGFEVPQLKHKKHRGLVKDGFYVTVAGHGGNDSKHNYCKLNCLPDKTSKIKVWQHAMGIEWINDIKMLAEAVPPAYAEYIGKCFLQKMEEKCLK